LAREALKHLFVWCRAVAATRDWLWWDGEPHPTLLPNLREVPASGDPVRGRFWAPPSGWLGHVHKFEGARWPEPIPL